jgi:putative transposase
VILTGEQRHGGQNRYQPSAGGVPRVLGWRWGRERSGNRSTTEYVLGQVPAPIAVVTDNGPCFRGGIYAEVFRGEDPLLRHVRTRVRSPQTNGVVERFFGSLKYEHLYGADIGDGDALAVEVHRFRHRYNTIRPHQALADRTPAQVYTAPGGGPGLVSA